MKLEDQTFRYIYKSLAKSLIQHIEDYENGEIEIENSKNTVHRLVKILNFLTFSDNLFIHPQKIIIAPNHIELTGMTTLDGNKVSVIALENAPDLKG